jgi:hypothetical protein
MIQNARWTPGARAALGALCAWTVFLWGNRISNAWSSTTESTSAKVISTILAVSFLVFALGGVVALVRAWRTPSASVPRTFLLAFAGWTVVVWVVRIGAILLADHSIPFKAVHAVLGVVSIVLAIVVARSVRSVGRPAGTTAAVSTSAQAHR